MFFNEPPHVVHLKQSGCKFLSPALQKTPLKVTLVHNLLKMFLSGLWTNFCNTPRKAECFEWNKNAFYMGKKCFLMKKFLKCDRLDLCVYHPLKMAIIKFQTSISKWFTYSWTTIKIHVRIIPGVMWKLVGAYTRTIGNEGLRYISSATLTSW